jgi:hypothetical protein
MFLFCLGLTIGGIAYIVYVALSLSPTDLQLAIRYTAFGDTHLYREKWWYLLSFIGFGVLFIVAHVSLVAKLYAIGMRQLAQAFALLSLIVLLLMFVYTHQVLSIAYLN